MVFVEGNTRVRSGLPNARDEDHLKSRSFVMKNIDFEIFSTDKGENINCGVYIGIDASANGFKVGKSSNIVKREKEIRNMNPNFTIVFTLKANWIDLHGLEKTIHRMFESGLICQTKTSQIYWK